MKKRYSESSGDRKGSQQSPEISEDADPIHYVSLVKQSECAEPQTTNVDFSCEKEDCKAMNPNDKPIYEETF